MAGKVINIAHASSLEKAILQMKKVRKMRQKRKLEEGKKRAEMDDAEYEALKAKRHEKTLRDRVQTAMWDYERHQYPIGKITALKELLELRVQEIIRTEEPRTDEELKRIEGILNELRK